MRVHRIASTNLLSITDCAPDVPKLACIIQGETSFIVVACDRDGNPTGTEDLADRYPAIEMFRRAEETLGDRSRVICTSKT